MSRERMDCQRFYRNISCNATHLRNGEGNQIFEATSLLLIICCSLVANTTAVTAILRVRVLRKTPHNLLILNLSLADIGLSLCVMPLSVLSIFDPCFLINQDIVCRVMAFCNIVFTFTNSMTVVSIALDRVLIVTRVKIPTNSFLRVRLLIASAWATGVIFATLPTTKLISSVRYCDAYRACVVMFDADFKILYNVFMFGFIIPSMIMCYAIIGVSLFTKGQKIKRGQKQGRNTRTRPRITIEHLPPDPSNLRRVTFDLVSVERAGIENMLDAGFHKVALTSIKEVNAKEASESNTESLATVTPQDSTEGTEKHEMEDSNKFESCQVVFHKVNRNQRCIVVTEAPRKNTASCEVQTNTDGLSELDGNAEKVQGSERAEPKEQKERHDGDDASSNDIKPSPENSVVTDCITTSDEDIFGTMSAPRAQKKFRKTTFQKQHDTVQRRVALMGGLFVLSNVLCWVPYSTVRSLGNINVLWITISARWLAYCITIWDPMIYTFMNRRIRQEFIAYRKKVWKMLCKAHED